MQNVKSFLQFIEIFSRMHKAAWVVWNFGFLKYLAIHSLPIPTQGDENSSVI